MYSCLVWDSAWLLPVAWLFASQREVDEESLEGVWSIEELNKYLTKPSEYAPGTAMSFAGLKKDKDRADLIEYLKTLSESRLPFQKFTASKTKADRTYLYLACDFLGTHQMIPPGSMGSSILDLTVNKKPLVRTQNFPLFPLTERHKS